MSSPRFRGAGLAGCLSVLILGPALPSFAQEQPPPARASSPESVGTDPDPVSALSGIHQSLRSVEARIGEIEAAIVARPADRATLGAELELLASRRDALKTDFESIATGIDPGDYDRDLEPDFTLRDEIDDLLQPILDELKRLTAGPREIESLRSELGLWTARRVMTESALARLETLPDFEDARLSADLAKTRTTWEERRQLAENRVQALSFQLEQAEAAQPSFYESMRDGLRGFFRTRGMNFLLCVLAFFGTFFSLHYLHRRLLLRAPWMRRTPRPFYVRLIGVGLDLFSFLGALVALLLVLYATGDWVLMGIAILLLLGLALAARDGLPKFYDDARLLLNLGEIREGERVVFEGLPWRVESLSIYSLLKNERLRGGVVRLPVRRLSGLISRPLAENELWFPTEEGDWVDLPSRGKAKVVSQTPEWVQLVQLGGARLAMPTADFLAAAPVNLSRGFRVSSRLGIAYRHLAEATRPIPEILHERLSRDLPTLLEERDQLRSLKVEFASAGSSSLDFAIIADFDGSLAPQYDFLSRALQRIAVECCIEHGWEIPFPQITVHQAGSASA